MTEREKMLAGELYDCGDQELLTQWHKAKNLIREYNNLVSENLTEKREYFRNCLADTVPTYGLLHQLMLITVIKSFLEITVK